jgi:hypothetical protein
MFCLLAQHHPSTGPVVRWRFVPGIVTEVKRGLVSRVRVLGRANDLSLEREDWQTVYPDLQGRIKDPADVVRKLSSDGGTANEYRTFDKAFAAIKAAAGLA